MLANNKHEIADSAKPKPVDNQKAAGIVKEEEPSKKNESDKKGKKDDDEDEEDYEYEEEVFEDLSVHSEISEDISDKSKDLRLPDNSAPAHKTSDLPPLGQKSSFGQSKDDENPLAIDEEKMNTISSDIEASQDKSQISWEGPVLSSTEYEKAQTDGKKNKQADNITQTIMDMLTRELNKNLFP